MSMFPEYASEKAEAQRLLHELRKILGEAIDHADDFFGMASAGREERCWRPEHLISDENAELLSNAIYAQSLPRHRVKLRERVDKEIEEIRTLALCRVE